MFVTALLTCMILAPEDASTAKAARAMTMIDVIVERHIDPPAKQELVRLFCCELTKHSVPGLAREVSSAKSDDDLQRILEGHIRDAKQVDLNDCLRQVLLGLQLPGMVTRTADSKVSKQVAENRYVGTGIQLAMRPLPVMMKVFPGGPAHKAGALDGDIIRIIDGEPTKGLDIRAVIERLRGPTGSKVKVALQQPGVGTESREYTIVRGIVPLTTIRNSQIAADRVRVRLKSIGSSTVHELRKLESELGDTVRHVELDFRSLSNHHLHHGRLLANALLDEQPLGSTRSRSGEVKYKTEPGRLFEGLVLTILTNRQTAGTPEWIAAAIQANKRGEIRGEPTAGAGFVTESVPLDDEVVLELPVAMLRTEAGEPLIARSSFPTGPIEPRATLPTAGRSPGRGSFPARVLPDVWVWDR